MNPTRRGYGVLAIVAVAELFAFAYGARALNAVAAPGIVALVAAYVQVRRVESPTAERSPVPPGFPGDEREVDVEVDGNGVARVSESVPDGLAGVDTEAERTLPMEFSYALELNDRGSHTVGPLSVRVSDVLGLLETEYHAGSTGRALVYPPVYKVAGRGILYEHVLKRSEVERTEFDTLREYAPGDPLRDVHWKTTAKAPDDIFVTQFADRQVDQDVVIAASSAHGAADGMATAAASIAVMALDHDLGVELRLPEGTVSLGYGSSQRESVLEALATTEGGSLTDGQLADREVDVHVDADAGGVTVAFGEHTETLEAMTVSRENPLVTREVGS